MSEAATIHQLERQLAEPDNPTNITDHHRKIDSQTENPRLCLDMLYLAKWLDKSSGQGCLFFQPDQNPFDKFVIIPGSESGAGITR